MTDAFNFIFIERDRKRNIEGIYGEKENKKEKNWWFFFMDYIVIILDNK